MIIRAWNTARQIAFVAVALALLSTSSQAQFQEISFTRITTGMARPVYATVAPGDAGRLYVVEQHVRRIRYIDSTTGAIGGTYLTLPVGVSTGNEQGLLGLAFHPDYVNNGLLYVYYTASNGDTFIDEFTRLNANAANPASRRTIMTFDQPFSNHNGGWIDFGPDGLLYIGSGDGGAANDPGDRSQDITNQPLGKMLRIDVNGDDFPSDPNKNYVIPPSNPFVGATGDDEIFMYGLRNPWRCSFDRQSGDLWIADVGQNAREEIDLMLAGSAGGQNYGWKDREGTLGSKPPGAIDPVHEYTHSFGFSVTGGYCYHGPVGGIDGHYFFADYATDRLWSFKFDGTADETQFNGSNTTDFTDWTALVNESAGTLNNIASFAEDEHGNMFVIGLDGEIFRLDEVSIVTIDASVEVATVDTGILRGGDESSLATSDNVDYRVAKNPTQVTAEIIFDVSGTSHTEDPSAMQFTLEASVFSRPALTQVVEMFNYDTGGFEEVDSRAASRFGDSTAVVTVSGDLSRFVEPGTKSILARIKYVAPTPRAVFSANVDHIFWTITN